MTTSEMSTQHDSIVHMLSSTKEVFAKIEGSRDVSAPILTFTHGSKSQFSLIQRNKLLEKIDENTRFFIHKMPNQDCLNCSQTIKEIALLDNSVKAFEKAF